jgi:hypothetical protein
VGPERGRKMEINLDCEIRQCLDFRLCFIGVRRYIICTWNVVLWNVGGRVVSTET